MTSGPTVAFHSKQKYDTCSSPVGGLFKQCFSTLEERSLLMATNSHVVEKYFYYWSVSYWETAGHYHTGCCWLVEPTYKGSTIVNTCPACINQEIKNKILFFVYLSTWLVSQKSSNIPVMLTWISVLVIRQTNKNNRKKWKKKIVQVDNPSITSTNALLSSHTQLQVTPHFYPTDIERRKNLSSIYNCLVHPKNETKSRDPSGVSCKHFGGLEEGWGTLS